MGAVDDPVRVADGVGSSIVMPAPLRLPWSLFDRLWYIVPIAQAGEASLKLLRDPPSVGRNQPTFGGSLCSSSGQRLATTARVSSEMIPVIVSLRTLVWIRCRSAGIITLPPTIRGS